MSKPTLKDIAAELGVTTAAVSKALNDLPGVSDALRLKAKRTAEALGYTRHLVRSPRGARGAPGMRFIVVLYGRIGGHLIEAIQLGIDEDIRRRGYHEIRYLVDVPREKMAQDLLVETILREPGVAGVLACYVALSDVHIARFQEKGIGVALLENHTEFGRCVTINNYQASRKAVRKLIALGRRRIGCIMAQEDVDHVWKDRLDGYRKALREKRLRYDPSLIVYENWFGLKDGELATAQLLQRRPEVDAILYGSDLQAYGGLVALRRLGKRVPEDIAVIGFDDMPYNTIVQPTLSSVRQPIRKMAEIGLRLLLDSIEKRDFSHRAVVLDTELILRDSCGLAPRRGKSLR